MPSQAHDRFPINAIEIQDDYEEDSVIDFPYLIKRGYYHVPRINKHQEGKPQLLFLRDYNNDGKKHEFALFDALSCMGLGSTLIGYSEKQDKVIQYKTELKTADEITKNYWVDYLFIQKFNK